jgi:hypothetical protein
MINHVYQGENLPAAFNRLNSGDTLIIHGGDIMSLPYDVKPDVADNQHASVHGAAITIANKQNLHIIGAGQPIIRVRGHGTGILIRDCFNVTIGGITVHGEGVLRDPNNTISYALIMFYGANERICIRDCGIYYSGNHGIAHLWGKRLTCNSTFERNQFLTGGNYSRGGEDGQTPLQFDGAALAVGGSRNRFVNNHVADWLRGIEIENPHETPSSYSVIEGNLIERCTWQSILVTPDGVPGTNMDRQFKSIRISNNIIIGTGTKTEKMSNTGIYVSGGDGIQIIGNQIRDIADGIGILLQSDHADLHDFLVLDNMIHDVDRTGIQLSTGASGVNRDNVVRGNLMRRIKGRGVYMEGTRHLLSDNNVIGCEWEPYYHLPALNSDIIGQDNSWDDCKREPFPAEAFA